MTKEELEKEAEEIYIKTDKEFMDCQDEGEIFNLGYLASAEPREKQIEIDAEQIRALQKQNGELTDKVKELEVRCNELFLQTCEQAEKVKELEAQIEKMKRHSNCKHRSEYNEFDPYSKVCQSCCNLEKWEFGEIKEK